MYQDGQMSNIIRNWQVGSVTDWRGPLGSFSYHTNQVSLWPFISNVFLICQYFYRRQKVFCAFDSEIWFHGTTDMWLYQFIAGVESCFGNSFVWYVLVIVVIAFTSNVILFSNSAAIFFKTLPPSSVNHRKFSIQRLCIHNRFPP